jgi:predicted DNA-binding antitoxin AbrB/MazE fold protein
MQIEAIYQDGRLEFTRPIHFKAGAPVRLLVEVSPDALVEIAGAETAGATTQVSADHHAPRAPSEPHAFNMQQLPSDVIARLEQRRAVRAEIFGRPPMLQPESPLTEEQQQRDRAFAERDAWRAEQGRP